MVFLFYCNPARPALSSKTAALRSEISAFRKRKRPSRITVSFNITRKRGDSNETEFTAFDNCGGRSADIDGGDRETLTPGGNRAKNCLIHDFSEVSLLSDDCSAVCCGRRWNCCGNVLRCNAMFNLGDKDHRPNGIFRDDGMAGRTAYGSLIVQPAGGRAGVR